jgi:hypothetical protein
LEIGKPKRVFTVEPLYNPVPQERPETVDPQRKETPVPAQPNRK